MKELFLFLAWLAEGAEQMKSCPDMELKTPVEGIFNGKKFRLFVPPYNPSAAFIVFEDRFNVSLVQGGTWFDLTTH